MKKSPLDFHFTGKSRPMHVRMSNDRTEPREVSLMKLRMAREEREREVRRNTSATNIQRIVRGHLGRLRVNSAVLEKLQSVFASGSSKRLFQAVVYIKLLGRGKGKAEFITKFVDLFVQETSYGLGEASSLLTPSSLSQIVVWCRDVVRQRLEKPLSSSTWDSCRAFEQLSQMLCGQIEAPYLGELQKVVASTLKLCWIPQSSKQLREAMRTLLHSVTQNPVTGQLLPVNDALICTLLELEPPVGQSEEKSRTSLMWSLFALEGTAEEQAKVGSTALRLCKNTASDTAEGAVVLLSKVMASLPEDWGHDLDAVRGLVPVMCRLVVRASKSSAFVKEILHQLQSNTGLFASMFSRTVIGALSSFAESVAAQQQYHSSGPTEEQIELFTLLDEFCALFIVPWLNFAVSLDKKRIALPLISRLAYHPGLLLNLWRALELCKKMWVSTDAVGLVQIDNHHVALLFAYAFVHNIDGSDFVAGNFAIPPNEVGRIVRMMKGIVLDSHMQGTAQTAETAAFSKAIHLLLNRIHALDEARPFLTTADWVAPQSRQVFAEITVEQWNQGLASEEAVVELTSSDDEEENANRPRKKHRATTADLDRSSSLVMRTVRLLQHAPFIVPFEKRVELLSGLFRSDVFDDRRFYGGGEEVVVNRGHEFLDAFDTMKSWSPTALLGRPRVKFQNEAGFGDGVFREFMLSVCNTGFATETGLFVPNSRGELFPNALSSVTAGPEHLRMYQFLGRMIGKAMREGVLIDVVFAPFFRNVLLGRTNGINDLAGLDPELYHHLTLLRNTEDVDSLELTFSIPIDRFGKIEEVPLVPNGAQTSVTNSNVIVYIHLMADFKLNRETKRQTEAFRQGLEDVVDPRWLRMFDSAELQTLVQGIEDNIGLDIEDWRKNTRYGHNTGEDHPSVSIFWEVVSEFSPLQQRKLLKFVTSMSRAPLLGFRHMSPNFTIYISGTDVTRLPSAATCMCQLKLPPYPTKALMKEKLLTAIEGTGTFELS